MTQLLALLALASPARAASLDLVEVGGAFGTPGATNPTAIWWNPAGLAVGGGTQFLVEGAPVFATIAAQRANPDYGVLAPTSPDFPSDYDYSGTDNLKFNGVAPFLGVSSDFTVPGLAVGIGLAVPTARGGTSDQEWGANRFHIREGNIQAIHAMVGAGYHILEKVALGASFSLVDSSWYADTDTTAYPDLAHAVQEELGLPTPPPSYQDGYIEDRGYSTTLVFGGRNGEDHGALRDRAATFGLGLYVTPVEQVGVAVSYNHGVRLDHEGDLDLIFQCPPDYDFISRFAAEDRGLCNARMSGVGKVGYNLPSRVNLGVVVSPIEKLRLEAMGSYVRWSQFTDYEITTEIAADQVDVDDPEIAQETADLVSQDRLWARDNRDTFWIGLDAKAKVHPLLTVGGRVIYDRSAIPDSAVSANNYDANTVMLTGLAMVQPVEQIGVGLSFGHYFLADRTITNSASAVTIDADAALPDRYFYPSSNGTYSGSINRLGLVVHGAFGKDGPRW